MNDQILNNELKWQPEQSYSLQSSHRLVEYSSGSDRIYNKILDHDWFSVRLFVM